MQPEKAEIMALKALSFLAESDGALMRLMDLSGMDRASFQNRAGEPEVLSAVLDFLLTDDSLLLDFCEAESVKPKDVHMARHVLGGP